MIKSRDYRRHHFLAYIVAFVQSSNTKYQSCGSGSGIWCPFEPLDPGYGMGKNQDPDPGSGSVMSIPDHISESIKPVYWVRNT
jgi:hypothetical protein